MSDVAATTSVPEPAHVESWLRTLTRFEDARVVTVVPLTEGLSNVTVRVELTDAPVAAAVLRIQPRRGIFEPYDILREGEVLNHLAETAVPVPRVLAAQRDPRFFGAPFLLLEAIDAAHMPAPEADPETFVADLPAFAAAVAAIHAIDCGRRDWTSSAYPIRARTGSRARSKPLHGACRRSVVQTSRF